MLERLHIRDLALVDDVEVTFGTGLNVLTGETGTGKSLLVQSINLIVGERADSGVVRDGARAAVVEGEFRIEGTLAKRVEALLESWGHAMDGDQVIVRREVQAGGRSRAWVNQSAVTLQALRQLGAVLADLHGQHAHQSLLQPSAGVDTLDALAGLNGQRDVFAAGLQTWREATAAREKLEQDLAHFSERRETLQLTLTELDEAALVAGEEEQLKADAARLGHADRLRELIDRALAGLGDGDEAAGTGIGTATQAVDQAAQLDPQLAELLPTLEEARIAVSETARALSDYASSLDADPEALETVESRLDLIARLSRKYQRDVPALLAWQEELRSELSVGADGDAAIAQARSAEEQARATCLEEGRALSRKRKRAAGEWTARLSREMKPLGLAKARLSFEVSTPEARATEPTATGIDDVALSFSANPGEPPRPLQKVASGGELSRIMLALKTALEAQDPVDLLLFDEVDSGIGGAVAQAVGERLRRLSTHRQLICVTHLPMIAALADHHVRVSKSTRAGRTTTRFETVDGAERVDELSRMLAGGKVTETTRRQARELLGERPVGVSTR